MAGLAGGQTWKASAGREKQEVKAARTWSGVFKSETDEALARHAPSRRYLSTDKQWSALWKAWRSNEQVPRIDFTKELVLVETSDGPNQVGIRADLDEKGNLTTQSHQTLMAGPGFGYTMITIARQGIKTINGRALEQ